MSEIIVETRDLTKIYKRGKVETFALRGANLQVARGEVVSIMGSSGCGKTTLLNLLCGLDKPTGGEIVVDGCEITKMTDSQLTRFRLMRIGVVFQFHNLIPTLTAVENVEIPLLISRRSRGDRRRRALDLLEEVGLADKTDHRPSELSGGEQQRVAVARALANDPVIVLADEPTGNLDSKNAENLINLIAKMNEETDQTFIIITHDQQVAKATDRVIGMKDGVFTSEKTPFQLGTLYKDLKLERARALIDLELKKDNYSARNESETSVYGVFDVEDTSIKLNFFYLQDKLGEESIS